MFPCVVLLYVLYLWVVLYILKTCIIQQNVLELVTKKKHTEKTTKRASECARIDIFKLGFALAPNEEPFLRALLFRKHHEL